MKQFAYGIYNIISNNLIRLLIVFVMARFYSTEDIGIFYFILSIGSLIAIIGDLGIYQLIGAKLRRNKMNYFLPFFIFNIFLIFLGILFIFLIKDFITTIYHIPYLYLVYSVIFVFFFSMSLFFEWSMLALEEMKYFSLFSNISNLIRFLFLFLPFFGIFNFDFLTLFYSVNISNFLVALFSFVYIFRKYSIPINFDFSVIKDLPKYSLVSLFYNATNSLDVMIIKLFLSYEQVGLYNLAVNLIYKIASLARAFDTLIPSIKENIKHYSKFASLFIIPLFFGTVFLLPNFVSLLYGMEYVGKLEKYALLFAPWILMAGFNIAYTYYMGHDKPFKLSVANGIVLIANTILDFILVPMLGVSGAVLASTFSFLLYFIYLNLPFFKYIKLDHILKATISSLLMFPLLFIPATNTFLFRVFYTVIGILLGGVIFFVSSYALKLIDKEDVRIFLNFLKEELPLKGFFNIK